MEKQIKLNLACGDRGIDGFIGVDIIKTSITDIIADLEVFPYQWADGSVDEIFCSHYIEHTSDLIKFMDECYRILKSKGKMTIIAPYYNSIEAWCDPTHKRAISESSFPYFNKEWREQNKLIHYPIKSDFDFTCERLLYARWFNCSETERDFAITHYTNVVGEIKVILTKKIKLPNCEVRNG